MNDSKNVNLINFGAQLNSEIIEGIEKEHKLKINQIMIKSSLNLKKHSTLIQVHDLINKNKKLFTENEFFIINLPGLPIYAAFLMVELHALTGKFPIIVECLKDYSQGGIFSNYKYKRLYDCDRERTCSRENYKNEV